MTLVLPRFRYRAVGDNGTVENELCPVFTATATGDPHPDPTEVEAWEWVPWPQFRDDVLAGTPRGQPLVPGAGRGAPGGPALRSGGRPCPATPGCPDHHLTSTG